MKPGSIGRIAGGVIAAGVGALAAERLLLRPWYRRWGATSEEVARALPGDEIVDAPGVVMTNAVTIHARPEEIWPWLVQIGYKRGGFYSYDRLERLMGLGISSSDRILPEFQTLEAGDVVPFGPEGPYVPVWNVEPHRSLVLGGYDPKAGGASWSFNLVPLDGGETRLVSRGRMHWPTWTLRAVLARRPREPGAPGLSLLRDLLMYLFFEPGAFLMMRKMLLGIKQRAEARAGQREKSAEPLPEAPVVVAL